MKVTRLNNYLKESRKNEGKKLLPKEILFLLFLVLLLISGLIYYRNENYYQKLKQEKMKLLKEQEVLKRSYLEKKKEMEALFRKEGIENYARQKFNFLKPGEILVMPKQDK